MDEGLRKLRLERAQALLEFYRLNDVNRSTEETARLRQRGRLLFQEWLRVAEESKTGKGAGRDASAPADQRHYAVNEARVLPEGTCSLSYMVQHPTELVSEDCAESKNDSNSHGTTSSIIDHSLLDSVCKQHLSDILQIETLTQESLLPHETIEQQQEALNQLTTKLAQRGSQTPSLSLEAISKPHPSGDSDGRTDADKGLGAIQEDANAPHMHAQGHISHSHLETSDALVRAESLLACKDSEIREWQLKHKEAIIKCSNLEEENRILIENKEALQNEVTALTQKLSMMEHELIHSKERQSLEADTVKYLEQQLRDLQYNHNTCNKISHSQQLEEENAHLLQQCADAERGREAAEAALQRVEAEMKQTHAKLQEELEAALLEANERIAEHDELLQQKLEEQGEYYEKLLEEKSRLEPVPADGAELGDALHWKAESDGLMEEAQPAEQPRRAAAASRNPFASMSVPSQKPDSLVDQGGDDDD
ncbi:hypothetical protein TraAM80_09139, partial [Trypanosoma rangeli]